MKLVLIKWVDAISEHETGWKELDKVRQNKPPLVRSVGWIIKQTKSYITIVSSLVDSECDGDTTIPIGMVKEIIPLAFKK